MHGRASGFRWPQLRDSDLPAADAKHGRMSQARRAALSALEQEFSDLLRHPGALKNASEVRHRIAVARRILDISEER